VTEELVVTARDELISLEDGFPARRRPPDGTDRVLEWKRRPDT
jgi:hypothetical protein